MSTEPSSKPKPLLLSDWKYPLSEIKVPLSQLTVDTKPNEREVDRG